MRERVIHAMNDKLYTSIVARVVGLDAILMIAAVGSWIYVADVDDPLRTAGLWLIVHVLRVAAWLIDLYLILGPVRAWRDAETASDATLLTADAALSRAPLRASLVYAFGWGVAFAVIPALAWLGLTDVVLPGRNELIATIPSTLSCLCGLPALGYPLMLLLLDATRLELGAQCERRGLERRTPTTSLSQRMAMTTTGLALGPMFVLLSIFWIGSSDITRANAVESAHHAVARAQADLQRGRALGEGVELVEPGDVGALPEALAAQLHADGASLDAVEVVDRRRERAYVAVRTEAGQVIVAERSSAIDVQLGLLLGFMVVIVLWARQASVTLARTIMTPLDRLRDASKRVVEVGDLREMGQIPAASADEIGELIHNFNVMMTTFEQLADAAAKVANGDLSIEISSHGDLPDAFAAMIDQLHDVVANIRHTSLELATAASEIQAATQEQEAASVSQDAAMVSLGEIMRELTGSSTQVSESAAHVLSNAEGTLRTTDETMGEIAKLRQDIQGIDDLLGLINEIADRSDLLALNGSLEATRAGEAGRGFALVAAEMRRLAERVTGTVADVRQQVVNIQRSSESTVTATTRSHTLAEETAKAAREIVTETDRQHASSDLASDSVREVAKVIAQVKGATTQTRSTADGLRTQALTLERMIDAFKLKD